MEISTDNIMLIITSIYVLATIAIYIVNNISAQATRDQVKLTARQMQRSTDLQMLDRRLDLLKEFDSDKEYVQFESLLDILFPESVVKLEKELTQIRSRRQSILQDFYSAASHAGLKNNSTDEFAKVNRMNASTSEIQVYTSTIREQASKIKAPSGSPFLDESRGEELERDAIFCTKQIEMKKQEFFESARQFIKDSISQELIRKEI